MKLTLVGNKAALRLKEAVESKFDYIDITVYPTLNDFYAKVTIRSLDIDRMMVFEDGVDKTVYRKQFTGLVEYLGKNYPAIRLIMLFRDADLAAESTRILVSPLYTTMVTSSLKMSDITDLVELNPERLKQQYGYVLRDNDTEDDLNETYDDSFKSDGTQDVVSNASTSEGLSRTAKLPKGKEKKKRGFFGLFKKQKPVAVAEEVESDINEVVESDSSEDVESGSDEGAIEGGNSSPEEQLAIGDTVDSGDTFNSELDDEYPSLADEFDGLDSGFNTAEVETLEEENEIDAPKFDFDADNLDIDSELASVLEDLGGTDTDTSVVSEYSSSMDLEEDSDLDNLPSIDDLLDELEETPSEEVIEPVVVKEEKDYTDILSNVKPFESVAKPITEDLLDDISIDTYEPEFNVSEKGVNGSGALDIDSVVGSAHQPEEDTGSIIDIEGRKVKLKSMTDKLFKANTPLVDDSIDLGVVVEDVDVEDIEDQTPTIDNMDELEDIFRDKNTKVIEVERVVEREVKVPVEKIVEKIVEVPVERKVEVEKVVEVERVVHVGAREKVYRNGVRLVIVTGDRKTGVTKTALNLTGYYAKRGSALFVDMDKVRKGSLLYFGLDDIVEADSERQSGLMTIKTVEALTHLTYRYEKGGFDSLISLYGDLITDEQVGQVMRILSQQRKYKTVVIDCPLEDIHLLDRIIPFSEVVIASEAGVKDVLATIMGLSKISSVTNSGTHLLNNAHYVLPLTDDGGKFTRSMEYVKELFGLGDEDLDWSMIPVVATKSTMVELVGKL